jgi:hypothetical protein
MQQLTKANTASENGQLNGTDDEIGLLPINAHCNKISEYNLLNHSAYVALDNLKQRLQLLSITLKCNMLVKNSKTL